MNEQHRQDQLARIRAAIAECDRKHSPQEQARAAWALALPIESRQADAFRSHVTDKG